MAKAAEPPVTTCHTLKPPTAGKSSHSGGASIDSVVVACGGRKKQTPKAIAQIIQANDDFAALLTGDVEEKGAQILGAITTMRLRGVHFW